MLKKTLGFIIFFVALVVEIGVENISLFVDKHTIAFIVCSTLGLTIANYKYGMSRTFILTKVKKYSIFSSWIAVLFFLGSMLNTYNYTQNDFGILKNIVPGAMGIIFWGYLFGFLAEVFINEE